MVLAAAVMAAVAASVAAQRQFEELGKRGLPAEREFTRATVLGDVDGDGDLDLVVGNDWHQCRLQLNNGSGTFTDATATRMPVGSYKVHSLALGDVDGDSDLDLVVGIGGSFPGQSRLYVNNGTGTFTDATASRMPAGSYQTTSLTLGDVDGDGDLDLLVGNLLYSNSLLYLNNGTGTFVDGTATRMPIVAYYTCSLALGDVEGDGDLDLVVGNEMHASRLYLNNGSGTFIDATASRMPVGIYPTTSLALGDVDRDGDLDLVLGNRGQSLLYQNLLRQIDAPYVLPIGRNYQIDVYSRNGPASQVDIASPCLATATASIPVPPLGILGLDPNHFIPLPHFVVPQPAGVASLFLAVPNAPSLVGVPIHTQALLIQLPGQSLLTNVNTDIILR